MTHSVEHRCHDWAITVFHRYSCHYAAAHFPGGPRCTCIVVVAPVMLTRRCESFRGNEHEVGPALQAQSARNGPHVHATHPSHVHVSGANTVSTPASSTAPPSVIVHTDDSIPLGRHADVVDELEAEAAAHKLARNAPPSYSSERQGFRIIRGNTEKSPSTPVNFPRSTSKPNSTDHASLQSDGSSLNCMHVPSVATEAQCSAVSNDAVPGPASQGRGEQAQLPAPPLGGSATQNSNSKSVAFEGSRGDAYVYTPSSDADGEGGCGAAYSAVPEGESSDAPVGSITAGVRPNAVATCSFVCPVLDALCWG